MPLLLDADGPAGEEGGGADADADADGGEEEEGVGGRGGGSGRSDGSGRSRGLSCTGSSATSVGGSRGGTRTAAAAAGLELGCGTELSAASVLVGSCLMARLADGRRGVGDPEVFTGGVRSALAVGEPFVGGRLGAGVPCAEVGLELRPPVAGPVGKPLVGGRPGVGVPWVEADLEPRRVISSASGDTGRLK